MRWSCLSSLVEKAKLADACDPVFRRIPCYMACFGVLLLSYPTILILDSLAGNLMRTILLDSLVFMGMGLLVYTSRRLAFIRFSRRKFVRVMLLLVTVVVSLSTITVVFLSRKWYEQVVAFFLCGILLLIMTRFGRKAYYIIFSEQTFFNGSAYFLITTLILWWIQTGNASWTLIPCYIIFMSMYQLLHNRYNMENLMLRRGYAVGALPEKIRIYNMFLLLGTGLGLTLLWAVLRKPFLLLTDWVGEQAKKIVPFLIPKPYERHSMSQSQSEFFGEADGGMEALLADPKSTSIFMNVFLCIAVVAFFILVLWVYRDSIATIFQKKRTFLKRQTKEENAEYINIEESLSKKDNLRANNVSQENYRTWKRLYRQFCKMENTTERFRLGYALIVSGIQLKGISVACSDTTYEILEKAKQKVNDEAYFSVTNCYNQVRYGEFKVTEEAFLQLSQILKQMR